MDDEPIEADSPQIEMLRKKMRDACEQMAESQAVLKHTCDDFEVIDTKSENAAEKLLRAEYACRNAGMTMMRLTTAYLSALTAYIRVRNQQL